MLLWQIMISLSIGYPERLHSGYLDSKSCHLFQPYLQYSYGCCNHETVLAFIILTPCTCRVNSHVIQSFKSAEACQLYYDHD